MSSLPPYSTYRTDSKQMMFPQASSHGNILTFTPPGFKHALNVKFPDSRLPVCEKCKKNFKTRDMCRVRNAHTGSPWTTAYICITLDDSCTDEQGKYIDKPLTVRMVQWQPYCVKKPFEPKTPVCAACKKTNRTRSFCRERHKHRQLPWCTVYVLLSALDRVDPQTVVAAPSKLVEGQVDITPTKTGEGLKHEDMVSKLDVTGTPAASSSFDSSNTTIPTSDESKNEKKKVGEDDDGEGDDINEIAESRTFLAKVCGKSSTIHWLELAEYDGSDVATYAGHYVPAEAGVPVMAPGAMQPMDANQAQYYAYAAQQHQHALKSHQQLFFQMHQRGQPQYAQQPVAWHGHYQGQPVVAGQPAPHPQHAGVPTPVAPQPPAPSPARPPEETTTSPPVTAGEAAAQRRKKERQAAQPAAAVLVPAPAPLLAPVPAPPAPAPAPPTAGEAVAAARRKQQQQQAQQQQTQQQPPPPHQQPPPQWQMYQPHMYAQPGTHPPPPHGYAPHPTAHVPPHGAHPAATTEAPATATSPVPAGTHEHLTHPHYAPAPAQYAPPQHHPHQHQHATAHHHHPHQPPTQHQHHGSPIPHPAQHAAPQHTPPRQHPTPPGQHGQHPPPPPPHHEHPERPSDDNPAKRQRSM